MAQINPNSRPLNERRLEIITQFNVDYTDGKLAGYTGITRLQDGKVLLVDYNNNSLRLFDQSGQHLDDFRLTSSPCDVCVIQGFQVAVTLPKNKKVQLLTPGNSIILGTVIDTNLHCYGIVALTEDQLIVSGRKKDILYWCIVSMDGSVQLRIEVCRTIWSCSLATNNDRTHVYVSCFTLSAVYAYSIRGEFMFKYTHTALDGARGVAVDREDNMYVVGGKSANIHKVSPNRAPLHVFSARIPKNPGPICYASNGDEFALIGVIEDRTVVLIFRL